MSKTFLDKDNNTLATVYETSEVVANPTLSGNEANLTGLKIGGTKYVVGGGSANRYRHSVLLNFIDGCEQIIKGAIIFESNNQATLTVETLKQLFNFSIGENYYIFNSPCNQIIFKLDYEDAPYPASFLYNSGNDYFNDALTFGTIYMYSGNLTLSSITDTVTEL